MNKIDWSKQEKQHVEELRDNTRKMKKSKRRTAQVRILHIYRKKLKKLAKEQGMTMSRFLDSIIKNNLKSDIIEELDNEF